MKKYEGKTKVLGDYSKLKQLPKLCSNRVTSILGKV